MSNLNIVAVVDVEINDDVETDDDCILYSFILNLIKSYKCVSINNIPVNAIAPRNDSNDTMLNNTVFKAKTIKINL